MKMNKKTLKIFILLGMMLAVVASTGICQAADEITLKYASLNPPNHTFSKADIDFFKKVEEETNNRVKFVPYWSGSLINIRETLTDVANGVCDIGMTVPAFSKGNPIFKGTTGFFYGIQDVRVMRRIAREIEKKFPEFLKEWASVKPLRLNWGVDYQLFTRKNPVRSVKDLSGLQIKSSGIYVKILTRLGAVGVQVPMQETYIALQKGIVDGCLAPYETLKSFRFGEVIKYSTNLGFYGGPFYDISMNWDSWNRLPKDIQKAIEDNLEYWEEQQYKYTLEHNEEGIALAKENNPEFELITLSKEEMKLINDASEAECLLVAKELDDQGIPGTQMYKEIRRLAEEYQK
jgi:TRAP-type C4-dicarboxylate transport system substrate-binding protein